MNAAAMVAEVTLAAEARIARGRLELGCVIQNHSDEAIFVRAHPDDGTRSRVLVGRAYLNLMPGRDALHVHLLSPPPPPDVAVGMGILPLSVRVPAGAKHRIRVEGSVPVAEWNPYYREVEPERCDTLMLRRILVSTAWTAESHLARVVGGPGPETYWAQGWHLWRLDREIEMSEPFAVLERPGEFPRI